MSNGKDMIINSTAGLIKKDLSQHKRVNIFLKRIIPFGGDINVKVDLSNYVTKKRFKKCDTC